MGTKYGENGIILKVQAGKSVKNFSPHLENVQHRGKGRLYGRVCPLAHFQV